MSEGITIPLTISDEEFEELERLIEAADEWDALPWYKRIFQSRAAFIYEAITRGG